MSYPDFAFFPSSKNQIRLINMDENAGSIAADPLASQPVCLNFAISSLTLMLALRIR
jgi:hypothetical protein